jgi:hypothetical protein
LRQTPFRAIFPLASKRCQGASGYLEALCFSGGSKHGLGVFLGVFSKNKTLNWFNHAGFGDLFDSCRDQYTIHNRPSRSGNRSQR